MEWRRKRLLRRVKKALNIDFSEWDAMKLHHHVYADHKQLVIISPGLKVVAGYWRPSTQVNSKVNPDLYDVIQDSCWKPVGGYYYIEAYKPGFESWNFKAEWRTVHFNEFVELMSLDGGNGC